MASLLDLPAEVLHHILRHVEPAALGPLARTCHLLSATINDNTLLWKQMYCDNFDSKPHASVPDCADYGWEKDTKRFVGALKVLQSKNVQVKRAALIETCQSIVDLLHRANNGESQGYNQRLLTDSFDGQDNFDVFLYSSSLYKSCGPEERFPHDDEKGRQLSAKVHCLHGIRDESKIKDTPKALHPHARARVYDLRSYTDLTQWGPFMGDGSGNVDWEKMEAITIVLGHNLQAYTEHCLGQTRAVWHGRFKGATPHSFIGTSTLECDAFLLDTTTIDNALTSSSQLAKLILQPNPPLDTMDPYGVTGVYRRVVCFLDYRDFELFNFSRDAIDPHTPRPPINSQEAIRLITMNVRATSMSMDEHNRPVTHFKGFARSMHSTWDPNSSSSISGTVSVTSEGEVRWTSISSFRGEARWRSEGIQVGGIRSGRGVFGTWFDKDYDVIGPAGPTAFWKLSDTFEVSSREDGEDSHGEDEGDSDGQDEEDSDDGYAEMHVGDGVEIQFEAGTEVHIEVDEDGDGEEEEEGEEEEMLSERESVVG